MDYWQIENVRVLLVEDNPIDARTVREVLSEARGAMDVRHGLFTVTRVERLEPALELLVAERFSVVLLDLRLPDSDGLETLAQVRSAAGNTPIVVLAGVDDDRLALAAIQQGAQDFLAKGRLESSLLRRTIRHAVERKRG
ncbi:MAG: response regulator, partial [Thermoguttaceae bacterium]